jgi:hypothetical protein
MARPLPLNLPGEYPVASRGNEYCVQSTPPLKMVSWKR